MDIRDHPRMCGEHSWWFLSVDGLVGSSPHVRGAHARRLQFAQYIGIIPACAGSTGRLISGCMSSRDHPRMCGEHFATWLV